MPESPTRVAAEQQATQALPVRRSPALTTASAADLSRKTADRALVSQKTAYSTGMTASHLHKKLKKKQSSYHVSRDSSLNPTGDSMDALERAEAVMHHVINSGSERIRLKDALGDIMMRHALMYIMANMMLFMLAMYLYIQINPLTAGQTIAHAQRYLLAMYEPEHSGTSVISTENINNVIMGFPDDDGNLADGILQKVISERQPGAKPGSSSVHFAGGYRLLALRMDRKLIPTDKMNRCVKINLYLLLDEQMSTPS